MDNEECVDLTRVSEKGIGGVCSEMVQGLCTGSYNLELDNPGAVS